MRHISLICFSLVLSLLMISCGGNAEFSPAKETISGVLGDYFKVVNRAYQVNNDIVNIEIERTANGMPDPWTEGMEMGNDDNEFEIGFSIEFLDEDGNILYKDKTDMIMDLDDLETIVNLRPGETASIPFNIESNSIASFRIYSSFKYYYPEESPSTALDESSPTDTTDAANLILDEYSEAMDSLRSEAQDAYDQVRDEVGKVYEEVEEEVDKAFEEVAGQVKDEVNDAIDDILNDLF